MTSWPSLTAAEKAAYVAGRVADEREQQGLPRHVEDEQALDAVARLVRTRQAA
jgi:hypothetical protein